MNREGFSLIELLVVISIIGILAGTIYPMINTAREKAKEARTKAELKSIFTALELYAKDHDGNYPDDVNRGLPSGLESHLSEGAWPVPSFSGAVYDWDSWSSGQLSNDPKTQVYQVSIRFCPAGGSIDQCKFPNLPWVQNDWDINSAVYYCVLGPCRSHSSESYDHPGYCIGGNCPIQ